MYVPGRREQGRTSNIGIWGQSMGAVTALLYANRDPSIAGRGLHSSTFRLKVSTICGIRWVHDFPPIYETGGHGEV